MMIEEASNDTAGARVRVRCGLGVSSRGTVCIVSWTTVRHDGKPSKKLGKVEVLPRYCTAAAILADSAEREGEATVGGVVGVVVGGVVERVVERGGKAAAGVRLARGKGCGAAVC